MEPTPLIEGETPPPHELTRNYVDKTPEEIIELLLNPKKCKEEGFDWAIEMHVHGYLLKTPKKEEDDGTGN